jgi:uncharacterized cupredoxin-like copper-binding protein
VTKTFLLAALLAATPALAQAPDWSKGTPVGIVMTNQGFTPARIVLKNGAPYALHFRNRSDRTHSFSAPPFFRLARVAPRDAAWVAHNEVSLKPGQSATLHIIAPDTPGARYEYRSTRIADAASKMKGAIFVK